ncbi:MAG: glycosyltransferase [Acutalibacteraceae bacterium]
MKILFFIPTLGGGGAERTLVQIVNNYKTNDCDIFVKTLFNEGSLLKQLNKEVNYSYVFKKSFRGNIHFFKLFSPRFLFRSMIKEKYDIIISFLEGPATRIVSGCNYDAKLINWVHTSPIKDSVLTKSYRNRQELINCYSKFDETVFVAKTAQTVFFEHFPELAKNNSTVYYNPINTEQIKHNLTEVCDLVFDKNEFNIVSVGRLEQVKGFDRLINIASKINEKSCRKVHFYIIGDGTLRENLKSDVQKKRVADYVTFVGFQDNPHKYLKQADLYVCSSYREGYSTAVIESLVVGIPVVTTECSGMREILGENEEYGIITENNESSLQEGIEKLLFDSALYNKYKLSAEKRGEEFDMKKSIEELNSILFK